MVDLFATQMLRTKLARSTPHSMALQMREMMRDIGVDPDADPNLATPTEAAIRMGAVKSFLKRDRVARSMVRLVPALFEAGAGQRFIISDDPVTIRNAFPYGDRGLESNGIMVFLPIAGIDEAGEGLTARTTRVVLLALIAAERPRNVANRPTSRM